MITEELISELIEAMHARRNAGRKSRNAEENSKGFVLRYISQAEGEVNPSDLCREMNVTTPRITSILNEMEKDGLIERSISRSDRRRISVVLTKEGESSIEERRRRQQEYFSSLAKALGEEDTKAYIRILNIEKELAQKKSL